MPQRFTTLPEWLAWFETLHPKKVDMSLERIRTVLDTLVLRPPPYAVVTVGGTNGKGSCVSMLESIYREAGYRVGAFTSPHLVRFNERIRFDGLDATDAELVSLFSAIDAALGSVTLSYFEVSAVAALLFFERRGAEVAVLEVGMGGRLDAVNALDADCALIASIDLDHTDWLGPDRDAIGREKAGVMRPGRPVVVGDPDPPASLAAHAREIGAGLLQVGRDFNFRRDADGWSFESRGASYRALPEIAFGGGVQLANASSCIAAVESLRERLPVSESALRAGLRNARLRGRSEHIMHAGVEWLFDVAHNPSAARVLCSTLDALPARRTIAVFAAMEDKDLDGVLAPFVPRIAHWHIAQPASERGATVEAVAAALARLGVGGAVASSSVAGVAHADIGGPTVHGGVGEPTALAGPTVHAGVAEACVAAAQDARAGERVLVFGSFYTVGPALEALGLYSTPLAVGG